MGGKITSGNHTTRARWRVQVMFADGGDASFHLWGSNAHSLPSATVAREVWRRRTAGALSEHRTVTRVTIERCAEGQR